MIWPEEWWFKSLEIQWLWKELGTKGGGVSVAIWDSGLDNLFGFMNRERIRGKNFFDDQGENYFGDENWERHGSEVARIIAASGDHWGVAPEASPIIARAVDDRRIADFRAFMNDPGIRKADIINISHAFLPSVQEHSAVIAAMTATIPQSAKIIVAAAGNYGHTTGAIKTIPAALTGVVSVNATMNELHDLYPYSTGLEEVTLMAPGTNMKCYFSSDLLHGTSFSCAIVSGICALAVAYLRNKGKPHDARIIKSVLMASCETRIDWHPGLHGSGVLNTRRLAQNLKAL